MDAEATELVVVDDTPFEDAVHPFKAHLTHTNHTHTATHNPPLSPPPALPPPLRLHSHVQPSGWLASVRAVPWKDLLPPSSIAAILASVVGCTPLLKNTLVSEAAPLGTLYQTIDMMAGATVPCMMLGLGATLVGNRGNALPATVVVAVTVVRLIVLPMLGTCCSLLSHLVVYQLRTGLLMMVLFDALGLLLDDTMFRLTLLLQQTVPTGITVQMIAAMLDFGAAELGTLLFWQYIAAIFITPAWTLLYFKLLGLQV